MDVSVLFCDFPFLAVISQLAALGLTFSLGTSKDVCFALFDSNIKRGK